MTSEPFDPYYSWLGIAPQDQPPTHYRLLSIDPFETNEQVISRAADRQMLFLRQFHTGPHVPDAQRLLNEVSAARLCLLDDGAKKRYDHALRKKLSDEAAAAGLMSAEPLREVIDLSAGIEEVVINVEQPAVVSSARAPASSSKSSRTSPGSRAGIERRYQKSRRTSDKKSSKAGYLVGGSIVAMAAVVSIVVFVNSLGGERPSDGGQVAAANPVKATPKKAPPPPKKTSKESRPPAAPAPAPPSPHPADNPSTSIRLPERENPGESGTLAPKAGDSTPSQRPVDPYDDRPFGPFAKETPLSPRPEQPLSPRLEPPLSPRLEPPKLAKLHADVGPIDIDHLAENVRKLLEICKAFNFRPKNMDQYEQMAELAKLMTIGRQMSVYEPGSHLGAPVGTPLDLMQEMGEASEAAIREIQQIRQWSGDDRMAINRFAAQNVDRPRGVFAFASVRSRDPKTKHLMMWILTTDEYIAIQEEPGVPLNAEFLIVGYNTLGAFKFTDRGRAITAGVVQRTYTIRMESPD